MQASIAFLVGIAIAVVLLVVTRGVHESTSGWISLALGASTAIVLGMGFALASTFPLFPLSIALGFATVIFGVGNLVRGNRHWTVWVGVVLGVLGAGFWLLFLAGELLGGG